jgi:hypothetical protein
MKKILILLLSILFSCTSKSDETAAFKEDINTSEEDYVENNENEIYISEVELQNWLDEKNKTHGPPVRIGDFTMKYNDDYNIIIIGYAENTSSETVNAFEIGFEIASHEDGIKSTYRKNFKVKLKPNQKERIEYTIQNELNNPFIFNTRLNRALFENGDIYNHTNKL